VSFLWSVFFVSWLCIRSVNWTDIGEALCYMGYQEMCLVVRLAVGVRQCYTGDVRTFRVLEIQAIYRGVIIPHLKVNFVRRLLKYLIIWSILVSDVLYRSEASSAHVQRAAVLCCFDICDWVKVQICFCWVSVRICVTETLVCMLEVSNRAYTNVLICT
jgi:hypothetical protein